MPHLSKDEVDRMARLARLELTEDERVRFADQLGRILEYAGQLARAETEGVSHHAHAPVDRLPERDDVPVPGLRPGEALASAPSADRQAGLFRVPRVIGQ